MTKTGTVIDKSYTMFQFCGNRVLVNPFHHKNDQNIHTNISNFVYFSPQFCPKNIAIVILLFLLLETTNRLASKKKIKWIDLK